VRRFTRGGVMAIVVRGGLVRAGDPIEVEVPGQPPVPLGLV
jgi:MOSC domain-containing protein YiiM